MIQDNNPLTDFYTLSPDKQAEVIDFILRLKKSNPIVKNSGKKLLGY